MPASAPRYRTIVADPPWQQPLMGRRVRAKGGMAAALPYPTLSLEAIKALGVGDLASPDCHLWLWTTNAFLRRGFDVLEAWGFRYLAPITWVKPTGTGNYFVHRTQTVLFGYRERCVFSGARYLPTVFHTGDPVRHSQKPDAFYDLVEQVSEAPRLELFARQQRPNWDVWGDEVQSVEFPMALLRGD